MKQMYIITLDWWLAIKAFSTSSCVNFYLVFHFICASTTPEGFYIVSGLQEVSQNTPFQARPFRRCWLWLKLWQCAAPLNSLWMEMALYKFQLLLLFIIIISHDINQYAIHATIRRFIQGSRKSCLPTHRLVLCMEPMSENFDLTTVLRPNGPTRSLHFWSFHNAAN